MIKVTNKEDYLNKTKIESLISNNVLMIEAALENSIELPIEVEVVVNSNLEVNAIVERYTEVGWNITVIGNKEDSKLYKLRFF